MRLRRFNEAESYDLSLDGFKDVMSDITDELKCDYDFNEYDERAFNIQLKGMQEPSHWYECLITLRDPEFPIPDDIPSLDYGFLDEREGGIHFSEDPNTFTNQDIRSWVKKIEAENSEILGLKSKIDNQVDKNDEIRTILIKLAKLQTRFKSFDNFKECRIGYDNTYLSIYFEMIT